jgi:hypothetical protein
MTNFGSSKTELNLKYRRGLEYALAKADFLNAPDLALIQAITIFLYLARRHDSPRFVWMMTGLVIRMTQYLGLQRDGGHLEHLTPFEIEMRRRVWWAVYLLDLRASEDQGTDLTIQNGSFDTKVPLNINDTDISPESKQIPTERDGVTDMSFVLICIGVADVSRQMMGLSATHGAAGLEEQSRLLNEIYLKFEQGYLWKTAESGDIAYWVVVTVARLVMAKMTLIVFLPVLFSSPSDHFSDELKTKLLVSAIEVAEYNHALNSEQACRHWRWVYQTYTHWHAIVFLLIEISRRPWSPTVERAWVALHSSWLIPAHIPIDQDVRMWFPLRKLMAKARKHRDAELERLRADPQAAARLDVEDRKVPIPSSSVPSAAGSTTDIFRERWRKLLAIPEVSADSTERAGNSAAWHLDPSTSSSYLHQPTAQSVHAPSPGYLSSDMSFEPTYLETSGQPGNQTLPSSDNRSLEQSTTNTAEGLALGQILGLSYNPLPTDSADWLDGRTMGPGFQPWLWADTDPAVDASYNLDVDSIDVNMDLDGEVNWYNWVVSAAGMESSARSNGNGRN